MHFFKATNYYLFPMFLNFIEFQLCLSQIWSSSKWSLKDEYKLLSELGGSTGYYGELFEAPYEHPAHPHYASHSGKFLENL